VSPSWRMAGRARTVICLLRNDLRVADNEALVAAHGTAAHGKGHLVPLYCFDPAHFKGTWHFGFPRTGGHRARLLLESVADLRASLRGRRSDLVVEQARPLESIRRIVAACKELSTPVVGVVYQKEVTFEELQVEEEIKDFCKSEGLKVTEVWGSTLYHREDIPYRSAAAIPDTYTQFRKEVEGRGRVRAPVAAPANLAPPPPGLATGALPTLAALGVEEVARDPRSAFPFPGGESAALARLRSYLWDTRALAAYKETRNGLVGTEYSTKLSPWLALGCLSPRTVHAEVKRFEKEVVANQSTYWVIFELLWRDYFRFVCLKFGNRVFQLGGLRGKELPWSQDMAKFEAWAEGRTGVPWVDANMRELRATGWMSNRGRQNVASFLVKDLGLDWRLGAEWFESQLVDHDVASNYGNWNYAAGVGNDPREGRKFNMIKQALDYDGQGEFVRLWVEEVRGLEGTAAHTPWALGAGRLAGAGLELGTTYPRPMVVAPEWSKHYTRDTQGQKPIQDYFQPRGKPRGGARRPVPRGGRVQY